MRKIILVPALLGVMGIGGVIAVAGGSLVGSASELSIEQVKEKALKEVNGTIRDIDVEKEGNKKYYEIEIVTQNAEYELKFDASTGDLVKKYKDNRDDQKQVTNNTKVTQNNVNDDDFDDDYDDDKIINTGKVEQNSNVNITKIQTEKTQQQQPTSTPAPNPVIKDDDYYDDDYDDLYDDDRYKDDDNDLYDDDRYEDDDDDLYDDDHDNDD